MATHTELPAMASHPDQIQAAVSPTPAPAYNQDVKQPIYGGTQPTSTIAQEQHQYQMGQQNPAMMQQQPQQSYTGQPQEQLMQQHQQYTSDGSQAAMMKQDPAMPAATAAGAGAGAMNGSGAGVPGYNQEQKQEFGAQRPANAWKFECLDVFSDMDLCLMGYFLPCVLYGRTATRIKDPTMASHNDVNVPCISWCALCSIAFCGCGYWQWIIQMMQRGDIRRRHGVDGSGAEDCLMSACCSCCALIQEEREMRDPLLMGSGQAVGVQQQQQQPAVNGYQSPEEQAAGMQYKA